ncbi:MAG TPA: hypothetical protein VMV94_17765 [Phycisphaerae bacterium]|nr:hypothetical protein [Phycisphaerae bacterium]
MAMSSSGSSAEAMSSGRRVAIGANVAISILVAAALLVAVNWICSIKYFREDLAAAGNFGLSDRTKRIIQAADCDIQISTVYPPNEEDAKQQEYVKRIQDYCDELTRFSSKIKVTYVVTSSQREKLVSRISGTFGGEAAKHKEALETFAKLRDELEADLKDRLDQARNLMGGDSWLGDFPLFANIAAALKADVDTLKKAGDEIKELTPAGGIPKYGDATNKAKTALGEVKGHLKAIGDRMNELAALADEASKPDSANIQMLREVAVEPQTLVASLRDSVGPEDAPLPGDPAVALKAFADRGVQVSAKLEELVKRVDGFARKFPMVKQHPSWAAPVKIGPLTAQVEVADVLRQAGKTLENRRLLILGVIDTGKSEQLSQELADARHDVTILEQNAAACQQLLSDLAARLSKVDPASKALLDLAKQGTLFGDKMAAIDALEKQIESLPELKLGSLADQLKEDNVIVVEAKGKIRVVPFAEVFPVRESIAGPTGHAEELGRSFNGDSALSSAILAITRDKPCATVVVTSFEPPPPQQRSPFMPPPPESWVPSRALSELRKRLEGAGFKVVDWNMATAKERPAPEEGTEAIYVCLPPPPPSSNPFGGQQPQDQMFGEAQRQMIRDLLANDAKVIFLATWEVRGGGMFGGPPVTPPYGYGPLLDQDWGIRIDNSRRITWVEPDRRAPNTFMVRGNRFGHMPASGFTDQEIGKPLRGTRFLINDACPIDIKKDLPAGVTTSLVLQIPHKENYIGATISELIHIIDQVRQQSSEGRVTLTSEPRYGPFDVMVTAQRKDGDNSKGRIIVVSFGGSYRDDYLENPVLAEGQTIRFDPPPTEDADLFVNALYWLSGHPEWIARGPMPVPRITQIDRSKLTAMRIFVWGVWPAVVFLPGIVLWVIRRR